MENEAQEFQTWLRKVGSLAKEGDQDARRALWEVFVLSFRLIWKLAQEGDQGGRDALWIEFNALASYLAQLAASDIASINFDLFEGVLRYCYILLNRGLSVGDSRALVRSYILALDLCESIERARRHPSGFVAEMEATVSDWPIVRHRGPRKRSAQLAKMIFERIKLYRLVLIPKRRGIESRDKLTRQAEWDVRVIQGANEFKEVAAVRRYRRS